MRRGRALNLSIVGNTYDEMFVVAQRRGMEFFGTELIEVQFLGADETYVRNAIGNTLYVGTTGDFDVYDVRPSAGFSS